MILSTKLFSFAMQSVGACLIVTAFATVVLQRAPSALAQNQPPGACAYSGGDRCNVNCNGKPPLPGPGGPDCSMYQCNQQEIGCEECRCLPSGLNQVKCHCR